MMATAVMLIQSWRVTDRCTAAKTPLILIPPQALLCVYTVYSIQYIYIFIDGGNVCMCEYFCMKVFSELKSGCLNVYVCVSVYISVCSRVLLVGRQGPLLPKVP